MSEIEVGRQIGVGSSKSVYEGWWKGGEKIAVLRVRQPGHESTEHRPTGLPREAANFLRVGQHAHLTELLGVADAMEDGQFTVLTEFAPFGSLDALLERRRYEQLTLIDAVRILQQVSEGMDHIARAGFVHTDLSLRNILVYRGFDDAGRRALSSIWSDLLVKVTDLAGAVYVKSMAKTGDSAPATAEFSAPDKSWYELFAELPCVPYSRSSVPK